MQLIHEETYHSLRAFFENLRHAICARCGATLKAHMLASFSGREGHSFEDQCCN
jgi:hypothetical protein